MKFTAMMAIVAVMGMTAWAGESGPANEPKVTVCMERGGDMVTTLRAQTAASKMFSEVGVKIEWHGQSSCPADALRISLSTSTPANLLPSAWAYALPYEGSHIVVFCDRIQKAVAMAPGRVQVPSLLAHVLVHEITHILQGFNRHSASGVMKTRWDFDDFSHMDWKPLQFTEEDVMHIHQGLNARASRLAGAILVAQNSQQ